MTKKEFTIVDNMNLKKAIRVELPFLSNYQIDKILENKDIKVNGKRIKEYCELCANDFVEVYYDVKVEPWYEEIYSDENILIVNKKSGIEVISEDDRDLTSILNLDYNLAYPIHRIDRNTEGLVIFAKTKQAEDELLKAFKDRTITKKYLLEVKGKVNVDAIKPRLFLKKLESVSKVIIAEIKTSGYDEIKTIFKFVRFDGQNTLLEAELITGKTHQIRAHISYYGHSIVGDGKYGKGDGKLHLTSYFIKFKLKDNSFLSYLNEKHFEIMPTWIE